MQISSIAMGMVMASWAAAAAAAQCGYDYCWGAVGFGPGGAYGFSHGHVSEQDAYNAAQDGCGWDCTEVRTFYNSCAAMAVGQSGGWGWAYDRTRSLAERNALNYCADYDYGCQIRVWACSP